MGSATNTKNILASTASNNGTSRIHVGGVIRHQPAYRPLSFMLNVGNYFVEFSSDVWSSIEIIDCPHRAPVNRANHDSDDNKVENMLCVASVQPSVPQTGVSVF